jgi:hypothetical protein
MTFLELCESIFQKWLKQDYNGYDDYLLKYFQLDYCPEPYLILKGDINNDSNKTLYFLTTNPGNGENYQHITSLNQNVLSSKLSYKENSKKLSDIYLKSTKKIQRWD